MDPWPTLCFSPGTLGGDMLVSRRVLFFELMILGKKPRNSRFFPKRLRCVARAACRKAVPPGSKSSGKDPVTHFLAET